MRENTFKDKFIVVTGASSGLGRALSIAFSEGGAHVAMIARKEEGLLKTKKEMAPHGKILNLRGDLAHHPDIQRASQEILSHFPHIDLLINNASSWNLSKFEAMDPDEIQRMISGSVSGTILLTQKLIPHLKKAPFPHVINVISTAALPHQDLNPSTASLPYFVLKWGQAGFSEALRAEFKSQGIRVTSLYPGAFDNTKDHRSFDEKLHSKNLMPLKEVVEVVLFAASRSPTMVLQSIVLTPP